MLVISITKLMTQEDKDRPDEILEALKRLREEREDLSTIVKTVVDKSVYQRERVEAEGWEEFKNNYPPEMHSAMEESLRDIYNGDVEQLMKDWIARAKDSMNKE